jgi:hypothetical protein
VRLPAGGSAVVLRLRRIIKASLTDRQDEVVGKGVSAEVDSDEDIELQIEAAKQAAFKSYEDNPEKARKKVRLCIAQYCRSTCVQTKATAKKSSKDDDESDFGKGSDDSEAPKKKKAAPKKAAASTSKAKGKAKPLVRSNFAQSCSLTLQCSSTRMMRTKRKNPRRLRPKRKRTKLFDERARAQ